MLNQRKRNYERAKISRRNPDIGVLLVQTDSSEFPDDRIKIRRSHPRRSKSQYRLRDKFYDKGATDSSAVEESESHERNAGNPYTVHKNHYKQNWMWNHVMTGDHMNVNPYAPLINNYGPSGAALIFGRKWWYFNQRRTFFSYDRGEVTNIAGVPHSPKHLPLAEPIIPGHTLIRPALGMLKSSLKFPHMDFEDGSGVYGNTDNIGLRYNGANERVMYTNFRRRASDYIMQSKDFSGCPRKEYRKSIKAKENKDTIRNFLQQLQQLNLQGNNIQSIQTDPQDYQILRLRPVKPITENLNKLKEGLRDSSAAGEFNSEEDKPEDKEMSENNAMKQKFPELMKTMRNSMIRMQFVNINIIVMFIISHCLLTSSRALPMPSRECYPAPLSL
ncbi:PREDICTED: uncharacterized protein LOC106111014 [Papilio polytes]|uniref:uncharacterized protein LOC106111014 n=1 Tax=Papilio polytes TaxID=76194 RepID=UPI0006760F03|nr:PREDICTED: uncharacterized protein LOC106111014 [Papilio polytes]